MAGVPASIRPHYLPDTSLERRRYSNQLDERLPKIFWIKKPLGRPRRRWFGNENLYVIEMEYGCVARLL
jgi:hypothetical protein